MGDEEVGGEALGQALGQQLQRQGRVVGGDDGAVLAHTFQALVEVALHLGIFQHRLDDPVAVGEPLEVVLQVAGGDEIRRSEEHTSELQSLMRISYAVFCLKKKNIQLNT